MSRLSLQPHKRIEATVAGNFRAQQMSGETKKSLLAGAPFQGFPPRFPRTLATSYPGYLNVFVGCALWSLSLGENRLGN